MNLAEADFWLLENLWKAMRTGPPPVPLVIAEDYKAHGSGCLAPAMANYVMCFFLLQGEWLYVFFGGLQGYHTIYRRSWWWNSTFILTMVSWTCSQISSMKNWGIWEDTVLVCPGWCWPRIYSDPMGFHCVVSMWLVRRTPGDHARSVATPEAKMLGGFGWCSHGKPWIFGGKNDWQRATEKL